MIKAKYNTLHNTQRDHTLVILRSATKRAIKDSASVYMYYA